MSQATQSETRLEDDLLDVGWERSQASQSPLEIPSRDFSGASRQLGYSAQLFRIGIPLWLSDCLSVAVAFALGVWLAAFLSPVANHNLPFVLACISVYSLCLWSAGMYSGVGMHPARELKQVFRAIVTASLAIGVVVLLFGSWRSPYAAALLIAFPAKLFLFPVLRGTVRAGLRKRNLGVPFYFLGAKESVERVCSDMERFGGNMLRSMGRFSSRPADEFTGEFYGDGAMPKATEFRGLPEELPEYGEREGVHWLVVVGDAPKTGSSHRLQEICSHFSEVVWIRPERTQACAGGQILSCGLATGIRVEESLLRPSARLAKRLIDIFVAGSALLFLLPLFAVIASTIYVSNPGPIFFSHERIGRRGKRFKAWKFRSMVVDAPKILEDYLAAHPELRSEWNNDHKLKVDPRITAVGRILRKTSLDEIPQLWNVFVGEMSLVGPRPIVEAEIEKYGDTFSQYLRVTPGISGLWQISGRNNTTYAERLAFDEFYVRHWSPWLDLYILMRTVRTVVYCEGAY